MSRAQTVNSRNTQTKNAIDQHLVARKDIEQSKVAIDEDSDSSTEAYYFQAIEEAGLKIQTQRRDLDEIKGKHEITHKILREKADEVKTLRLNLEIERRKNEIFQNKNKNFNKETISNKINQCFKKRDKAEEDIIKKNLEAYEKSLRDEFL